MEQEQTIEQQPQQPVEPVQAPAQGVVTDAVAELAAKLAEAEMRGYKRGLNERIEAKMNEPALFEPLSGPQRGSIWDK